MSKWIKATDKLPEWFDDVMTYSEQTGYRIGFYKPWLKKWGIYTDSELCGVELVDSITHWTPFERVTPEEWE